MRLSSIWTCSGALLTSVGGAACNKRVHKCPRACTYVRTCIPLEPLTVSAALLGNQASGDRSTLAHVYIHGLNLASFLSAAGKRNVFNLHNPHLACSPRRKTYRESRTKVRFYPFSRIYVAGVCVGTFVSVRVQQDCVRAKEKIEISHHIPDLYSRLSGSCASQFEWEDGSCTQQMLCVY